MLAGLPADMRDGEVLKCASQRFAIRPYCGQTVFVSTVGDDDTLISQLMIQCLSALLDTSKISVRPLMWKEFTSPGNPN